MGLYKWFKNLSLMTKPIPKVSQNNSSSSPSPSPPPPPPLPPSSSFLFI